MSYILDALKKLEHEKSRKNRASGMTAITGELFENERPRPSGTAGWKIALAVLMAILLTFGATWYFLKPGMGRVKSVTHLAVPAPSIAPAKIDATPAPPVPLPVPAQPVQPAPQPTTVPVTIAPVKSESRRQPAPSAKTPTTVQAVPVAEDSAALFTMQEIARRKKDRKVQTLPAEQMIAAPADIKLSGIAWQDERPARRAVVNGFLMQEGGVVSGARITDIYQDRVRFSLSGKSFEIPLISSGAPASEKH